MYVLSLTIFLLIFIRFLGLFITSINQYFNAKDNDEQIRAKVISVIPNPLGEVQPVLEYYVNDQHRIYIFHNFFSMDEISVGDEITINLSKKNGLAYDKKDLIKGILYRLFFTIIFLSLVLYLIYIKIY